MVKLTDLPSELLLLIMEHTDTESVLRARLAAGPKLGGACRDILLASDTMKTLYVHPSRTALDRTIAICADPECSKRIEIVHFLGQVSLGDWSRTSRQYSWPQYFYTHSEIPDLRGHISPWSDLAGSFHPTFVEAYQPLFQALSCTTNLRAVRHSDYATGPGLNKVSRADMIRWTEDVDKLPTTVKEHMWSDADPFLKLLDENRLRSQHGVPNLALGEELSKALSRPRSARPPAALSTLAPRDLKYLLNPLIGRQVTRLELSLCGGIWSGMVPQDYHCIRVLRGFAFLQDLRVAYGASSPGQDETGTGSTVPVGSLGGAGRSIEDMIRHLPSSMPLRRLHLTSTSSLPPVLHYRNWETFVTQFQTTLKRLILSDIVFVGRPVGNRMDRSAMVDATTDHVLRYTRDRLSLDTASIYVRRRNCRSDCAASVMPGVVHHIDCDLYMREWERLPGYAVAADAYKRVAANLNVAEQNGGWDFGDFVLGR